MSDSLQTELGLLLIPINIQLKEWGFQLDPHESLWRKNGVTFGYRKFSESVLFQLIPEGSYFGGSTDPSYPFSVYGDDNKLIYERGASRHQSRGQLERIQWIEELFAAFGPQSSPSGRIDAYPWTRTKEGKWGCLYP
jgi:hypothetical protein